MSRLSGIKAIVLSIAATVGVVVPVSVSGASILRQSNTIPTVSTTIPVSSFTARIGQQCSLDLSGADTKDVDTGALIRCKRQGDLWTWQGPTTEGEFGEIPEPPSFGIGPFQPGKPCWYRHLNGYGTYEMMSPTTGALIRCERVTDANGNASMRWVEVAIPVSAPTTTTLPNPTIPTTTTVTPQYCGPDKLLPEGFTFPPGTSILDGSPILLPSDNPEVKDYRCQIKAQLPLNSDPEAIYQHFINHCEDEGWYHNPNLVGRYTPEGRPIPRGKFGPGDMLIAYCKSPWADPVGIHVLPWYFDFSVTSYVGTQPDELIIELKSYTA